MLTYDVAELKRPLQAQPRNNICGDGTLIIEDDSVLFLSIFDGAGHGLPAYRVTQQALNYVEAHTNDSLNNLFMATHEYLRGTLGGVLGICRINKATAEAEYAGLGNTAARIMFPQTKKFINRGGILGYEITNPVVNSFKLNPGDIFLLYSDGIKDHFDTNEIPGFFTLSAAEMVRFIIENFAKELDDASVIALKVEND